MSYSHGSPGNLRLRNRQQYQGLGDSLCNFGQVSVLSDRMSYDLGLLKSPLSFWIEFLARESRGFRDEPILKSYQNNPIQLKNLQADFCNTLTPHGFSRVEFPVASHTKSYGRLCLDGALAHAVPLGETESTTL